MEPLVLGVPLINLRDWLGGLLVCDLRDLATFVSIIGLLIHRVSCLLLLLLRLLALVARGGKGWNLLLLTIVVLIFFVLDPLLIVALLLVILILTSLIGLLFGLALVGFGFFISESSIWVNGLFFIFIVLCCTFSVFILCHFILSFGCLSLIGLTLLLCVLSFFCFFDLLFHFFDLLHHILRSDFSYVIAFLLRIVILLICLRQERSHHIVPRSCLRFTLLLLLVSDLGLQVVHLNLRTCLYRYLLITGRYAALHLFSAGTLADLDDIC